MRLDPGARFPDVTLDDHAGNARSLSDLVAGDPTVLRFHRGFWCPEEQAFFRRLLALQDEAEVASTRIVSISVDEPRVSAAFRSGLGARWTFLSDPDRRVQGRLGLREATDTAHRPCVPRVFTLFPDLTIHRVPRREARRLDARVIDAGGAAATVSLVLAPPGVRLLFDDPVVQGARRRVIADPPFDAVTTLLRDASHFEGALTVARGSDAWRLVDEPFSRVFPARVLRVEAGLLGRTGWPAGPVTERYGSDRPWPSDRFADVS